MLDDSISALKPYTKVIAAYRVSWGPVQFSGRFPGRAFPNNAVDVSTETLSSKQVTFYLWPRLTQDLSDICLHTNAQRRTLEWLVSRMSLEMPRD